MQQTPHYDARQTQQSRQRRRDALNIRDSRRNAIDYHAMGLPKDHWHRELNTNTVCQRPDHLFGVFFHTNDSEVLCPTLGVAFTECEYGGEGIEYPYSPMSSLLPPQIGAMGREGILIITWPGYAHIRYKSTLYLDTTIGDLASQVTRIFRDFYNNHSLDFKAPGIRLGPAFVTYDRLRLRNIFFDGQYWNIESSYVYENDIVWDLV